MLGNEEIENRFGFHKATVEGDNATLPKHAELRRHFREFSSFLDDLLPDGRAKSVMFTELENASMWAHKAVAEMSPLVEEVPKWELWYLRKDPTVIVEARFFDGHNAASLQARINQVQDAHQKIDIPLRPLPETHWVVLETNQPIRLLSNLEFLANYEYQL